ncbi:MAG: hypothetical protein ACLGHJ_01025 [Gammaproteobacteria bacterium]
MNQPPGSTVRFRLPDDRDELARLKRLTGLDYESVPESLLQRPPAADTSKKRNSRGDSRDGTDAQPGIR